MAGYAPVFDSIYTGTLYGRWPAAAVWASLLPLFDRHGELDMSIEALCGMTGWPRDLLEQGIAQLMEPDPRSRTQGHEGRRMVPIDPDRAWGWRAVNHGQYREKARLMAKNSREVEEGKNAARLHDRRRPPETAETAPHSHTQSHSQTREREKPSLSDFDLSECPKDMNAASEQKACDEYHAERGGITQARWRSWVLAAKESGRYAKQKPRPPTDAEIRAERNRIAAAQS